jgi:hypothetical protein
MKRNKRAMKDKMNKVPTTENEVILQKQINNLRNRLNTLFGGYIVVAIMTITLLFEVFINKN